MSAKDVFHNAVKNALQKEGWIITDDPLFIRFGGINIYIDLGAEKVIGAEKDGQKIAVEIKSFLAPSAVSEFHLALGQFLNYRLVLERQDPERILYLAISVDAYDSFFILPFTQMAIQHHQLKLIVYEPETEVIVQWQE